MFNNLRSTVQYQSSINSKNMLFFPIYTFIYITTYLSLVRVSVTLFTSDNVTLYELSVQRDEYYPSPNSTMKS